MGPSYVYVPTLPEPYRGGAPVLPHGAPGAMFMPRMDPPFQDPILKQIEYYFRLVLVYKYRNLFLYVAYTILLLTTVMIIWLKITFCGRTWMRKDGYPSH